MLKKTETRLRKALKELKATQKQLIESEKKVIKRNQKLLLIFEGTASVTGHEFFRSLVHNLGLALGVRYAFVSEFTEVNTRVRTLAFWSTEGLLDNVEYDVTGTPCAEVLCGEIRHYPESVQVLFPEDKGLLRLKAEGYMAIPLKNLSGRVSGHLAVLDDRPMPVDPQDLSIFKIFAARAASELERIRAENTIRKSEVRFRDLYEELKTTQGQLIQSERMAALGQLTAGIVHEINTPIGTIKTTVDTIGRCSTKIDSILEKSKTLTELKENNDYQKSARILKENGQVASTASDRITKVVTSLKNFTRLDQAEFEKADINEGLDSTLTLIQLELKDGVRLEKSYGDIPKIQCYPSELNQVFMTLLRNAAQATEKKGALRIKTAADENYVYVIISDTGKGMPPDKIKTLFDLRFATKGTRMGMRLGLISAYNIIQKHNGNIKVESELEKGTEFTITLPVNQNKD